MTARAKLPSAWARRICCGLDEAGPSTFVAADALVLKVREAGRVVNVHALIAVGVNAEGYREILDVDGSTAEDGAGWLTFWALADRPRDLRGTTGHLRRPRRSGGRDRRHPARRDLAALPHPLHNQFDGDHPKALWPWVRTLSHSVFNQPDKESVAAQYGRIINALLTSSPRSPTTSKPPCGSADVHSVPKQIWRQICSNNPQERLNKESGVAPTCTDRLNHQLQASHDDAVHHIPGLDSLSLRVGSIRPEPRLFWVRTATVHSAVNGRGRTRRACRPDRRRQNTHGT